VIEQKSLTGGLLADRILALAADRGKRQKMSVAARRLAKPDAAERIVDVVVKLAGHQAL
jgi:UDP-N-acetylglucosamine:LPS N-acetylglucosamine transferase